MKDWHFLVLLGIGGNVEGALKHDRSALKFMFLHCPTRHMLTSLKMSLQTNEAVVLESDRDCFRGHAIYDMKVARGPPFHSPECYLSNLASPALTTGKQTPHTEAQWQGHWRYEGESLNPEFPSPPLVICTEPMRKFLGGLGTRFLAA